MSRSTLSNRGSAMLRLVAIVFVASCLANAMAAEAAVEVGPASAPSANPPTTSAAPLRIVVTDVNGKVQRRNREEEPWTLAQVGDELAEGSELRTLPKSSVKFTILPDQIVAVDRVTTL